VGFGLGEIVIDVRSVHHLAIFKLQYFPIRRIRIGAGAARLYSDLIRSLGTLLSSMLNVSFRSDR
jgi:hypothetical protein